MAFALGGDIVEVLAPDAVLDAPYDDPLRDIPGWLEPLRTSCADCGQNFTAERPRYPFSVQGWFNRMQFCVECTAYCSTCTEVVYMRREQRSIYSAWRIYTNNVIANSLYARYYTENCQLCSTPCERCRQTGRELIEVESRHGYANVCDECWDECNECGNQIVSGLGSCRACREDHARPGNHERLNYSYKPEPRFHGVNNNPYPGLYMGMEQELEPRSGWRANRALEHAKEVADRLDPRGLLYFKDDGSLDNGVEIVSHPMSIPYFREEYPWDLWKPNEGIGKAFHQTAHTGIHIHVSKAAFTKAHAYRFNAFHYLFPDFVELIAGRPSNHYTEMRPAQLHRMYDASGHWMSHDKGLVTKMAGIAKSKDYSDSRYWGINTQNEETFELRYFRSTIDAKRLKFYAEWLEAAFLYTQQGWVRSRKAERMLTPHNMRMWCEAQRGTKFSALTRFLVAKGV